MKKPFLIGTAVITGLGMLCAAPAMARVNVDLHIGVPVYAYSAPIYHAPVYVQPRQVYVQPRPVYVYPSYIQGRSWSHQPYRSNFDRDRDGIPNYADRDRDGDGVANRFDRRPDNRYRY
jgi:hypothetical protein